MAKKAAILLQPAISNRGNKLARQIRLMYSMLTRKLAKSLANTGFWGNMQRARGFTLLELLIVITLIALAYTLLPVFFFSGVSGAALKSDVRLVAGGLKLARDHAIFSRKSSFLALNLKEREFTVDGDTRTHKLHPDIELKLFTAQEDQVSEDVGTIRFYPDGSSNGGRVTIGSGARQYLIDIEWLTGKVTIDEVPDAKA